MKNINNSMFPKFKFEISEKKPSLDLTPHSVRMAACYRDLTGTYHLFTDFIDQSQNTIQSWQAKINYYRGRDLKNWEFVSTIIDKGKYTDQHLFDQDCYGAGSPDVVVTHDSIYLFYTGRGNLSPDEKVNETAKKGQKGYVSGEIMFARSSIDKNGKPIGTFTKEGTAVKIDKEWESMRIDDPCVLIEGEIVHLYYKGFNDNIDRNNIKIGYARASICDMKFIKSSDPIISVEGGCEMPKVFKYKNRWNMFLRHFENEKGDIWRHHISTDGINWVMNDPYLFCCAGPDPCKGATDLMLIKNSDGSFSGKALTCGLEDEVLKLWSYDIKEI